MKLVYTNYGILTEERVRELKECGLGVDECGMTGEMSGAPIRMAHDYHDMDEPEMGAPPKIIVIRGEGDMLEEGDTSTPADGGSVTGTQVGNVGPQGVPGSAASGNPGGANVPDPSEPKTKKEAFNRRAEALLEAWMEESVFEDSVSEELHGDQGELDVAPPYGKLTGADFKNLGKKSAYKAKHEEED